MTNEAIPDLPEFNDSALDKAFAALERRATDDAAALPSPEAVEAFRLRWLGRKQGLLSEVSSRWLKAAPPEAKKPVGERFKTLKELVERLLDQAAGAGPTDAALAAEAIDITLPGTRRLTGAEHPITRTLNEITQVFAALGYSVGVGPEVETDYYNFESMNFPPGCCCEPTPPRCRCEPWSSNHPLCASSSPARFIATTLPMLPTRRFFTRLKASVWTPTSPSAISRARWTTP